MKSIPSLTLLALLFTGCASTTLYDRNTGKRIARFQGDMIKLDYHDGTTYCKADEISHSAATEAGGRALARGTSAVGGAIANGLLAVGSSGVVPKAAGGVGAAVGTLSSRTQDSSSTQFRTR